MGPKSWTHIIKKYIEKKLNFQLFDYVICAWKVDNVVYETCRTTHDKTYKDLIRCTNLKTYKFCFLDDQYHKKMVHPNIKYIRVIDYKNDLLFENMINRIHKLHFIDKHNLRKNILGFVDNNKYGYKYTRKSTRLSKNNNVYNAVKDFIILNRKNKQTRRRKVRKNKTKKK